MASGATIIGFYEQKKQTRGNKNYQDDIKVYYVNKRVMLLQLLTLFKY